MQQEVIFPFRKFSPITTVSRWDAKKVRYLLSSLGHPAVWNVDLDTGAVTASWVNTDGSEYLFPCFICNVIITHYSSLCFGLRIRNRVLLGVREGWTGRNKGGKSLVYLPISISVPLLQPQRIGFCKKIRTLLSAASTNRLALATSSSCLWTTI